MRVSDLARYTPEDLERAKADLKSLNDKFDNYSGNNPDKHQSSIKDARMRVREIEAALKADGIIPLSPQEELERVLDSRFPKARSKEVVEYDGHRYQRGFTPLEKSRSGKTVAAWHRYWTRLVD